MKGVTEKERRDRKKRNRIGRKERKNRETLEINKKVNKEGKRVEKIRIYAKKEKGEGKIQSDNNVRRII